MAEPAGRGGGPRLTVIGEALIDLLPDGPDCYRARCGGSPFNVAVGLARLGHRTSLMARLSGDGLGRRLRAAAAAEHVDLDAAPQAGEPTSLAIVTLDEDGSAGYDFRMDGTADWLWTEAELARLPADTAIVHAGSLASWTPPGDDRIHAAISRIHAAGQALVSYDPNIRPALLASPALARPRVERFAAVAHVVKASREDAEWLYPGSDVGEVAGRWLALGALLVIVTDGPNGAFAYQPGVPPVHRPGRSVTVADTVGAGDAFTAGLLGGLARRGIVTPELARRAPARLVAEVADEAIVVSALTCQRPGADPPRAGEVSGLG